MSPCEQISCLNHSEGVLIKRLFSGIFLLCSGELVNVKAICTVDLLMGSDKTIAKVTKTTHLTA